MTPPLGVAIVGIGCRFPGATGPRNFWQLLCSGTETVRDVPSTRWDADAFHASDPTAPGKTTTRRGGFLDEVERFDAAFFGISATEAESMDPQQRLALETCWEALEDAAIVPASLAGTNASVLFGVAATDYARRSCADPASVGVYTNTGASAAIIANRVSYVLDLHGPSFVVDTACSSSLVATHLGCRSLRDHETDLVMVGGVNVIVGPETTIGFSKLQALAPDGRCRAFDAKASGFVRGEGCGVLVLKRLADAERDGDRIYGVIRGSAINQDGRSNGLTAPNQFSQEQVLRRAYETSGIAPGAVRYVEAHGTGTPLGDPIEVRALGAVLGADPSRSQSLRVGSVKTNIGHPESAAGVAGLIKVALGLHHRTLVPTLHFTQANPRIAFDKLRVEVQTALEPWETDRIAGVSGFGFGGVNAHVVLEGAPSARACQPSPAPARTHAELLTISAKSEQGLSEQARVWREHLARSPESLHALASASFASRSHHAFRLAVLADSKDAAARQLEHFLGGVATPAVLTGRAPGRKPKVAYVFSGHGSMWVGAARDAMAEPGPFRDAMHACDLAIQPHLGRSVVDAIFEEESEEAWAGFGLSAPTIFAIQVALAKLLEERGVAPHAVIAHSVGEVAAAHVAGVLSLADAAELVCLRSVLLDEARERGGLAVVAVDEARALALIEKASGSLSLAGMNAEQLALVAGPHAELERFCAAAEREGLFARKVRAPAPSHSPLVRDKAEELGRRLSNLQHSAPRIPWYSSVLGRLVKAEDCSVAYWVANMASQVRFADAARAALADRHRVFVELSPHPLLVQGLRGDGARTADDPVVAVPTLVRQRPSDETLLEAVAAFYCAGVPISWPHAQAQRLPAVELPTVAWIKTSHWAGAATQVPEHSVQAAAPSARRYVAPSLEALSQRVSTLLRADAAPLDVDAPLGELGIDSLSALALLTELLQDSGRRLDVGWFLRSSIRQLAQVLAAPSDSVVSPTQRSEGPGRAVWLRDSAAARLLVVVHPIGGGIECYRPLVRALGDVDCLGIERADASTRMSIEALAATYLRLVDEALAARGTEAVPNYELLGWSFGGFMAHEMARQLAERGVRTPKVTIVDSPAFQLVSGQAQKLSDSDLLRMFCRDMLRLLDERQGRGRALPTDVLRDAHTLEDACAIMRKLEIQLPATELLEQRFALFRENAQAIAIHRPRAFAGAVDLYAAATSQAEASDLDLGWRPFCTDAFRRGELSGDHYQVFTAENLERVVSGLT